MKKKLNKFCIDCVCGVVHTLNKIDKMSCSHISVYGGVCYLSGSLFYHVEGDDDAKQSFNKWLDESDSTVFNHHFIQ
jgi:predicted membrane channel-forming protein YqfA (hemolysin III family)